MNQVRLEDTIGALNHIEKRNAPTHLCFRGDPQLLSESEEIGPRMLARIARRTGLKRVWLFH